MLLVCILLMLCPTLATAASLTMGPSDCLACAVQQLQPGDTLTVPAGTYGPLEGAADGRPSGTASQPITIQAAPGATVVSRGLGLGNGQSYVTIKGIIFDAGNVPESNCIHLGGGAHHLTVEGGECRNAGVDGLTIFYGGPQLKPHDITIRGMKIHHNGYHTSIAPYVGHGLYINGDNITIACNEIYGNAGAGLQFGGYVEAGNNNVVRGNLVYANAGKREVTSCGIQTSIGRDVRIEENWVRDEPTCGIQVAWTTSAMHTEVARNTLDRVSGTAFLVFNGPSQTSIHHNLVINSPGTRLLYQDNDTQTTFTDNATSTPAPAGVGAPVGATGITAAGSQCGGSPVRPPLPAPRNLRVLAVTP